MEKIDCFIVGHNEVDANRQKRIIRLSYGENSITYKERTKYNLAQIKHKNNYYTPAKFFNKVYEQHSSESQLSMNYDVFDETFSLAVAYLGTYLHRRGLTFDYINSFNKSKNELESKLKNNSILTVAITTTYHVFPLPIIEIVSMIKKLSSTVKIIVGGPYIANMVRSMDEADLQKFFDSIGADVYIYSPEGEHALSETVHAIKEGLPYNDIKNIFYKAENKYVFTELAIEENDLDSNTVDWTLFSDRIGSNVNLRTSVSCPYSCAFCVFPKHAGRYRAASLNAIEKELNCLKSLGTVTGISIIDDTLNISSQFKEFLLMMIKNNYNFKWSSFVRCQYLDSETVQLMKESGCQIVFCGIESGSQQILDNINKKVKVEEYKRGLALLNEYGIVSIASIIVGLPGETYETFMETYNFIEETKPTFFQERLWAYDHKSPIHEQREKFKLVGSDYDWSHATMDSNTALDLGNKMFFDIKNSIHVTEYPIIFHLLNRGFPVETIKNFISSFNECLKENMLCPENDEVSEERIEGLINSLKIRDKK